MFANNWRLHQAAKAIRDRLQERSFTDGEYGWPLPEFVVDHVLQCREGRVVDPNASDDLFELFYRRTGPIAAAVAVTIDVAEDGLLPDRVGDGEAPRPQLPIEP